MQELTRLSATGLIALSILFAAGCATRHRITLRHYPSIDVHVETSQKVAVDAADKRPSVVEDGMPSTYLGQFRASFGQKWNAQNSNGKDLDQQFKEDVIAELEAAGVAVGSPSNRKLTIEILEWDFDVYENARFWYKIKVIVTDSSGKVLAEELFEDTKLEEGDFWTAPHKEFAKELPKLYSNLVREIVAGSTKIKEALQ